MTTATAETTVSHAERNAEGHAETILELYRANKALSDGAESVKYEGYEHNEDSLRDRVTESALSVQVRGDWRNPGEDAGEPTEFCILLTTGGPALRMVGDLDKHAQPENAKLEIQDWGTPWTEYRPAADAQDDWEDALAWWLGCFYFGE